MRPATNRIANAGFDFDEAGNQTASDGATYAYDAANRLKSVGVSGNTYGYDCDGRKIVQATGGYGNVYYLWSSVLGQPVAELTEGGLYRAYVYNPGGQMLGLVSYDGIFYWAHNDHLGSGHFLTDQAGNVAYHAEYDPHGQTVLETAPVGTFITSKKFTGYERNWATGLDDAQARNYQHTRGRFMRPDPLGVGAADSTNPQSLNRYAYVGNDPINATDPTGLLIAICHTEVTCIGIDGQWDCSSTRYCDFIGIGGGGGSGGGGGDPFGGGGGGGGEQKQPAPKDPCPPDKRRFFDWLVAPLGKLAQELNATRELLLTQAVKEGGWNKQGLDHNQPLNNPFGVNIIRRGKAVGNVKYASLDAAIGYWKQKFGDRVRGSKTPEAFGYGMQNPAPGQGQPYNASAEYIKDYKDRYADVLKYEKLCGIQ